MIELLAYLLNAAHRLVNDSERDVREATERGEIWVRGSSVMQGYLGNQKATEETMSRDGWLKTGDIACLKEGKVYIVDRKKVSSSLCRRACTDG